MLNITMTKNVTEATVITHGGVFHADEVFATVILSKIFDNLTILRAFKVPENLSEDVIVYDIGFGRFDHHQKGGNGCRKNGVPYAACGLLWSEFGRKVLEDVCSPELVELVWSIMDEFIQGIDAADNGALPKLDYPAQIMGISQLISGFNPNWNALSKDSDAAFLQAVQFADSIFDRVLTNAVSKVRAQAIIEAAIENSRGHIMLLNQFAPWQDFLFASENPKSSDIQFVVFPSNRGGYNWQCVPDAPGSFGQRKPVPAEWRGASAAELQELTGITTANFCHPNGFMGSAETLADAIAMAKLAVNA